MKISLSETKATFDQAHDAIGEGKSVANATEAVMDRQFIERSRHDWCWTGWSHIPANDGWYKIDRDGRQLTKIAENEALTLEWHERLFVYESALLAAKENSLLALYIGGEYADGRPSAL